MLEDWNKLPKCQPSAFLSTGVGEMGLEVDRARLLFWSRETEKKREGKGWKHTHGWGPYKLEPGN